MASKKTILLLQADPRHTGGWIDAEFRDIQEALKLSGRSHLFDIQVKTALRAADFRRALLEHTPWAVHFSGVGSAAGQLVIEDSVGGEKELSQEGVANMFKNFPSIRLVVLNACMTGDLARLVHAHIPAVVGLSHSLQPTAAHTFSVAFYDAIFYEKTPDQAFQIAQNALSLESLTGEDVPCLMYRQVPSEVPVSAARPAIRGDFYKECDRSHAMQTLWDVLGQSVARPKILLVHGPPEESGGSLADRLAREIQHEQGDKAIFTHETPLEILANSTESGLRYQTEKWFQLGGRPIWEAKPHPVMILRVKTWWEDETSRHLTDWLRWMFQQAVPADRQVFVLIQADAPPGRRGLLGGLLGGSPLRQIKGLLPRWERELPVLARDISLEPVRRHHVTEILEKYNLRSPELLRQVEALEDPVNMQTVENFLSQFVR